MFTALLVEVFALLTLACWVLVAVLLTVPRATAIIRPHALSIASATTGTATLGSIYLSEVAGWAPCELCWVQRIFMYSLAAILTVEVIRRLRSAPAANLWPSAVALALPGAAVSTWHIVIQRLPSASTSCDPLIPCSAIWTAKYGILTVPAMAGTAFVTVLALAWISRKPAPRPTETFEDAHVH